MPHLHELDRGGRQAGDRPLLRSADLLLVPFGVTGPGAPVGSAA